MKLMKVKDSEFSSAMRYIGVISKNLASVSNNVNFIVGQMKNCSNEDDRFEIVTQLQHLADMAQDAAEALSKAAKIINK